VKKKDRKELNWLVIERTRKRSLYTRKQKMEGAKKQRWPV